MTPHHAPPLGVTEFREKMSQKTAVGEYGTYKTVWNPTLQIKNQAVPLGVTGFTAAVFWRIFSALIRGHI